MVCFIAIAIMVGIIDWHNIIVRASIRLGFNRNAHAGNPVLNTGVLFRHSH